MLYCTQVLFDVACICICHNSLISRPPDEDCGCLHCLSSRYCIATLACKVAPIGIMESSILKRGVCNFSFVCKLVLPMPKKMNAPSATSAKQSTCLF